VKGDCYAEERNNPCSILGVDEEVVDILDIKERFSQTQLKAGG
jgi:hypothetical protein